MGQGGLHSMSMYNNSMSMHHFPPQPILIRQPNSAQVCGLCMCVYYICVYYIHACTIRALNPHTTNSFSFIFKNCVLNPHPTLLYITTNPPTQSAPDAMYGGSSPSHSQGSVTPKAGGLQGMGQGQAQVQSPLTPLSPIPPLYKPYSINTSYTYNLCSINT
jgi:hypothetical protein